MTPAGQRPVSLVIVVIDESPILAQALSREIEDTPILYGARIVPLTWARPNAVYVLKPDIVVLDLDRAVSGAEKFILKLHRSRPGALLLSYGSTLPLELAQRCIQLGVRALLPRSANAAQLKQALTVVARNGLYLDPVYQHLVLETAADDRPGARALSAREAVVLRKIAQGLSQKQAAADLGLSHKTVDTYKSRGMEKLGLRTKSDLVRHAITQGWLD